MTDDEGWKWRWGDDHGWRPAPGPGTRWLLMWVGQGRAGQDVCAVRDDGVAGAPGSLVCGLARPRECGSCMMPGQTAGPGLARVRLAYARVRLASESSLPVACQAGDPAAHRPRETAPSGPPPPTPTSLPSPRRPRAIARGFRARRAATADGGGRAEERLGRLRRRGSAAVPGPSAGPAARDCRGTTAWRTAPAGELMGVRSSTGEGGAGPERGFRKPGLRQES